MDAEEKENMIEEVITTFKNDIKELNALVNPGTPLEKEEERKSTIE